MTLGSASYLTYAFIYLYFSSSLSSYLSELSLSYSLYSAAYSFNGLERVASVPVPFPLDICMLQLPSVKYAVTLHKDAAGVRQFAVYVWQAEKQDYALWLQQPAPKAVALDCLAYAGLGYVAVSYNHSEPVLQARDGSPIYELSPERVIRTVQYFAGLHLRGMYLRISSQELTLLQAYDEGGQKQQQNCPYFKWTSGTFQRLGAIPCSNARRLEAFGIDYADYVAVANYASPDGRTATHSEIYKYEATTRRFQLFQRLRTNGAVDVKYFSLPVNEVSRRHFLIVGNTVGVAGGAGGVTGSAGEADTVIYVYDKGQFVPYQRLSFYGLERFLPVTVSEVNNDCQTAKAKIEYRLQGLLIDVQDFSQLNPLFTAHGLREVSAVRGLQQTGRENLQSQRLEIRGVNCAVHRRSLQ